MCDRGNGWKQKSDTVNFPFLPCLITTTKHSTVVARTEMRHGHVWQRQWVRTEMIGHGHVWQRRSVRNVERLYPFLGNYRSGRRSQWHEFGAFGVVIKRVECSSFFINLHLSFNDQREQREHSQSLVAVMKSFPALLLAVVVAAYNIVNIVRAGDPDPLQDLCVADLKSGGNVM